MTTCSLSWSHTFVLTFVVTLTIYATIEIEYRRQGLIRLTETDQATIVLRDP